MENASKALIIAGSVLIALMIISMSVFLFNKFRTATQNAVKLDEAEINAFNAKITPYFGDAVQGSKVNSLLQLCLSINMSAKKDNEDYKIITVIYPEGTIDSTSTSYKRVSTGNEYYKVECKEYKNALINRIVITKK